MKINLVAIGSKMPGWVETGTGEYLKRLPQNFSLSVTELPLVKRTKSGPDVSKLCEIEGQSLLKAVPAGNHIIALDVKGKQHSTMTMAERLKDVMEDGKDISMLVGGPDGLSRECLDAANEIWSLSELTLPHTIVRIVVAEQVYRAWSVLNGHPYHRE